MRAALTSIVISGAMIGGLALALSSDLFAGRLGDDLLLAGTALVVAGTAAWAALTARDLLRRERARRQRAARLYAEVMTAMAAALEAQHGDQP